MVTSLLCLLLLLLLLPANPLNQEGLLLLSFKKSILSDPQNALSNWDPSHPTPCLWNGIICTTTTTNSSSSSVVVVVVSITLPKKHLLGHLPASLSSLPSLRHINLRSNRLTGTLPDNLSSLHSLVLSHNSLSGPLPSFNSTHLKTLDISHNNFSQPLPPRFGLGLPALQNLDLSYNAFTGSIPGDIGTLSSLQGTADFSHNRFSGPIPASLGQLPDKVYIDLTFNNLSGAIPQSGALANRGPTAFIGNPGLCGPPLKNPCSTVGAPSTPTVSERNSGSGRGGPSRRMVVAIVVGDAAGIGLIAMLFFYCYWRATCSSTGNSGKGVKSKKECLCFRNEESETMSAAAENAQPLDLVALDHRQVGFDMDELLKSSAFVLGKSEMGIMYKVVLEDGLTLAVRRLGEGGSQRFREFQTEVEAIGKVRHPNIVTLLAYYWSVDEKLLVYEYIPNGNLSAAIHGRAGSVAFSALSWGLRLKVMRGTARGLSFLHEFSPKKYVHGDLKPSNILLGQNMEPYISDFGLGRLANIAGVSPILQQSSRIATEETKNQKSDVTISPVISSGSCYQAPEVLKALKPSQKWDVYSFGVILLELISGRSPVLLLETSEMDLVSWVHLCIEEKKSPSDVFDPFLARQVDIEDEIIVVLKIALACVQVNPDKRPSMKHIVHALDRLIETS